MTEKLQYHDFVELDYTGKLPDGSLFDTTNEKAAHEAGLSHSHGSLQPAVVCIGEKQLLPGLDQELEGKEIGKEYTVTLPPEKAFGKRDIKNVRIIPMSTFREHKLQPQQGLQVDVDGERGIVTSIAGGRVVVNFNHPLAGKEVTYIFSVRRKITDTAEQIKSFIQASFHLPPTTVTVEFSSEKAVIALPFQLPSQITEALEKKLVEITAAKAIEFTQREEKK